MPNPFARPLRRTLLVDCFGTRRQTKTPATRLGERTIRGPSGTAYGWPATLSQPCVAYLDVRPDVGCENGPISRAKRAWYAPFRSCFKRSRTRSGFCSVRVFHGLGHESCRIALTVASRLFHVGASGRWRSTVERQWLSEPFTPPHQTCPRLSAQRHIRSQSLSVVRNGPMRHHVRHPCWCAEEAGYRWYSDRAGEQSTWPAPNT